MPSTTAKQPTPKTKQPVIDYPLYRPEGSNHARLLTPVKHQLQTFIVFLHTSAIFVLPSLYYYLWTKPICWPFLVYYTVFVWFRDRSPSKGDMANIRWKWLRNSVFYRYFSDYFPIHLHVTEQLTPTFSTIEEEIQVYPSWTKVFPNFFISILSDLKLISKKTRKITKEVRTGPRYLFGFHPHGVWSWGATMSIVEEQRGFAKVFPGVKLFLLTLTNQFMIPFYRDYLKWLGFALVSKRSIRGLLSRNLSISIVIGGVSESLFAVPGLNTLVLNKRKGFVKIALSMVGINENNDIKPDEDDLCLVPCYSFGENTVYDVFFTSEEDENPKIKKKDNDGSHARRVVRYIQIWAKNYLGFTLPLTWSRGLFNYDMGMMPYRRAINTVVGTPIPLKRLKGLKPGDPVSDEEIEYFHKLYVDGLVKLFNDNKDKYLNEHEEDLDIVA